MTHPFTAQNAANAREQLETTQRGTLDVTPWLAWFLACLLRAVQGADGLLEGVLDKAQF
jgi:hypothetical protein